jgi:hypothetical protein
MAGINVEKYHGASETKAIIRHCDKVRRDKTAAHTNEQIDKSKTHLNFQWVGKGVQNSYEGVCGEYDKRLQEIDSKASKAPRHDRVTMIGYELPRPEKLPPEQFKAWSKDAIQTIINYYKQNGYKSGFLAAYGHVDEKHEYMKFDEKLQKKVKVTSREHIHVFFNPYSQRTDSSLNAKDFTSKKNLLELNKLVDSMTREKYGTYFCDGTRRKSKKSVEQLKSESRNLEMEEIERLEAENARLREENQRLAEQVRQLNTQLHCVSEREIPQFDYGSNDQSFSL